MKNNTDTKSKAKRWWAWIVALGTSWGLLLMVISIIVDPTPENWTLAFSVWTAGIYTLTLYLTKKLWLPRLQQHPLRNAVILGAFNAAVIETEFLVFEKIFGAQGVAAHPNLFMDLLITMPWYIMMCFTFVKVQNIRRFSVPTVLFLGGIYEIGGDGIVSPLLDVFMGDLQLFTIEYWMQIFVMMLWVFVPVYSSMVLPPAWLIETTPASDDQPSTPAWRDALKPMLWLIPFAVYVVILFVIMSIMAT